MKKRFCFVILISVLCMQCDRVFSPFGPDTADGFRIFTATGPYSTTIQMDSLTLSAEPFLTVRDLTAYYWSSHRITYGEDVYQSLLSRGNLYRKFFVVTVGDERIYCGVFTSMISSAGCRQPVILLDPGPGGHVFPREISIDRCYPDGWAEGEDVRFDPRIYASLKKAGVLRP
jgi:hypothetical protein